MGLLFFLFGVSSAIPSLVWNTLLGWKGSFIANDQRRVLKARPLCIFWAIWKVRNDIVFMDEKLSIQKVNSFLYIFSGHRPKCSLWMALRLLGNSLIGWDLDERDVALHISIVMFHVRGVYLFVPFGSLFLRLFYNIPITCQKKKEKKRKKERKRGNGSMAGLLMLLIMVIQWRQKLLISLARNARIMEDIAWKVRAFVQSAILTNAALSIQNHEESIQQF